MDYPVGLEEFATWKVIHTYASEWMPEKDRDRVAAETIESSPSMPSLWR